MPSGDRRFPAPCTAASPNLAIFNWQRSVLMVVPQNCYQYQPSENGDWTVQEVNP